MKMFLPITHSISDLECIIPRCASGKDTISLVNSTGILMVIMKVVTICLPESYLEGLNKLIDQSKYPNRSEIIRIAIRDLLVDELWGERRKSDDMPLIARMKDISVSQRINGKVS